MFLQHLASMHMAMILMIIDTQDMFTVQVLAFPALAGSLYFFDNPSFNKKTAKVSRLPYGLRFPNLFMLFVLFYHVMKICQT
jgi:hypothetical protein